ncbi:hypothetical protein ACIA8K_07185 [Catenuloplanes sp. NPDC051500]|uniref:hypothetical protein n=1 Tax=Catenuloplanes sp. NPDC051500 TaxID=3363959 RepID=UPI0037A4056F
MSIDSRAKGAALSLSAAGIGSAVLITIGSTEPDALPYSVYTALVDWIGALIVVSAVLWLSVVTQPVAGPDSSKAIIAEIGRLRAAEREAEQRHVEDMAALRRDLLARLNDARWQGYASALGDLGPGNNAEVINIRHPRA